METRRKHKENKQYLKRDDHPLSNLSQQCKKRGFVIMNSTFMPMAREMFNYLHEQAEDMDNPIFINSNVGKIQRVNQKLYVTPTVENIVLQKNYYLDRGTMTWLRLLTSMFKKFHKQDPV